MTTPVTPRRPRPTPPPARRPAPGARVNGEADLQARVDAFFAARDEDDAPRPALLARWGGNPRLRQRTCIGAIGVGIALFVAASLATPLAGAETAGRLAATPAPNRLAAPVTVPAGSPPAAAAAVRRTVPTRPTHTAVTAPVDHRAISGLAANGIPQVALNAYRVAAARLAHVQPGCGIDWALIAGIGREESDHGRFGGAVLHADGVSTPAIVGPALDGVHWDYIPVSAEYVRVTGDKTYAHALGPMQFIPTTWAAYGADADGDGRADIFDIDDAALGTARYLCAAGGNLRTHAGQVAGVLAYNHSDQYLAQVLALADAYRRGVTVTGIPLGNTTGSLPTVATGGYVPPANPGAPTAVDTPAQRAAAQKAAARAAAAAAEQAAAAKAAAAAAKKAAAERAAQSSARASGSRTAPASSPAHSTGSASTGASSSTGAAPGSSTAARSSTATPAPGPTCRLTAAGICLGQ